MSLGMVAIVGRSNVGKSTLFNQLTRSHRRAIVSSEAGSTRDRIFGFVPLGDKTTEECQTLEGYGYTLIDTGGFEAEVSEKKGEQGARVWEQSLKAIEGADLILLLVDGKNGLHQHDREILHTLQRGSKNFLVAVNKIDGDELHAHALEFYNLGINELFPISAAHKKGLPPLTDRIESFLRSLKKRALKSKNVGEERRVALIGRPNVGKSSLLNRLVGEERSLVSNVSGTTRDAIDATYRYNEKTYRFVDTAGIRRKTKVKEYLESQSVVRSVQAIDQADIVLIVLDCLEGMRDQDARLLNLAISRYKPVIVVVNKWDLLPEKETYSSKAYAESLKQRYLKNMSYIPIHFISCQTNFRVHKLLSLVAALYEQSRTKIATSRVNETLAELVQHHSPRVIKSCSRRTKFYYSAQVQVAPPTFVFMCNTANELQLSYKRYMQKVFRNKLELDSIPIKLIYRGKKEQKQSKKEEEARA